MELGSNELERNERTGAQPGSAQSPTPQLEKAKGRAGKVIIEEAITTLPKGNGKGAQTRKKAKEAKK